MLVKFLEKIFNKGELYLEYIHEAEIPSGIWNCSVKKKRVRLLRKHMLSNKPINRQKNSYVFL